MSTCVESTKTNDVASDGNVPNRVRQYLSGGRGLVLLAVLLLGSGVALNWSWLVVAGVAPVLLALAPCAAMCALGLCMSKMAGKSGLAEAPQAGTKDRSAMYEGSKGYPQ